MFTVKIKSKTLSKAHEEDQIIKSLGGVHLVFNTNKPKSGSAHPDCCKKDRYQVSPEVTLFVTTFHYFISLYIYLLTHAFAL